MTIFTLEDRIIAWIGRYRRWLFLTVVTILALFVRYSVRDFTSNDYTVCLLPWYEQIRDLGFREALRTQVGNYNIPYQFLIAIFAQFSWKPLYAYKTLSVVFDLLMAWGAYLLVRDGRVAAWSGEGGHIENKESSRCEDWAVLVYAVVLFLPTVCWNSGVWAQCDSMYTCMLVYSLWFLMKENYRKAFLFLGFAFAWKLQAVFLLPLFLIYYMLRRKCSILNLVYTLLGFYLPALPGMLGGRSVLAPFQIYLTQTEAYPYMYLNYPSFWALIGDRYDVLKGPAILLTLALLGCILFGLWSLQQQTEVKDLFADGVTLVTFAAWTAWTCVLFLPAMHERYSYVVDILLVASFFLMKKGKWLVPVIVEVLASAVSYTVFLYGQEVNFQLWGALNTVAWIMWGWMAVTRIINRRGS